LTVPSKFPKIGQSLADLYPEIAAQADGWNPATVSHGSHISADWKCELGHSWNALVKNRVKQQSGCPVCSGRKAFSGFNDLSTTHPELAAQAVGWDPTSITSRFSQKVSWKCNKGHVWNAAPNTRSKGHGCPMCSGHTAITGVTDLATTHPELAAQAVGWDPTTLSAGSNKKVAWSCHLGHVWEAQVINRSIGGECPFCGRAKVLAGFNDLATTHPELAAQADGWDPTQMLAGSSQKRNWICSFGHQWISVIASRASGVGCPICVGAKVLAGFNDLATTHPELAAQADGWDPTTINQGSDKKVSWRCENDHRWKATVGSRSYGNGCPTCAVSGFDPNQDGWLYFIDHDALDMFQVGISNVLDGRLQKHSNRGWEVLEVRGPMEGHLAKELEKAILHAVERRGAILGHKAGIEKFDGYSEAWTKDSLEVSSFKQLLDWVYEDDDLKK
jgi:tRNA(Arg) A34 adenosine deaminase TadA